MGLGQFQSEFLSLQFLTVIIVKDECGLELRKKKAEILETTDELRGGKDKGQWLASAKRRHSLLKDLM